MENNDSLPIIFIGAITWLQDNEDRRINPSSMRHIKAHSV